jgi:hypothetical protein
VTTGRRLAHMNRSASFGRSGLIVSGPARTGKTTAITQLGKTIEVIHRRRYPGYGDHIPVIYITAPPAATPRMIAAEFARFLGIPFTRQANITDIIEAACGVCTDVTASGLPWSPRPRAACGCTATSPAPSPAWPATSTSGPAG